MIRRRVLVLISCLATVATGVATAQAPPQQSGPVYRVGGAVTPPRAISTPSPEYSDEARNAKYEGTVVLWLVVGTDGRPHDVRVARSQGMGLDEKAVEAVRQWRFEPARKDGEPVAVQINVEVNFRLPRKNGAGAAGTESAEKPQSRLGDPSAPSPGGVIGGIGAGQASGIGPVFGTPAGGLGASPAVRISSGVAESLLVSRTEPVYPALAFKARVEGTVELQAIVGKDGSVEALRVKRGHPMLTQAALDAVKQWKYKPYLLNGEPVEVQTVVSVEFKLTDAP